MTDEELVERLKAHDEEAYREVLARYGDALYSYVYHLTLDHHQTEDIVAGTYLRIIEKIHAYTYTGAPLKAWLYRIAHNLAMNSFRQSGRTQQLGDTELAHPAPDDPSATVATRMDSEALRDAIVQLTDDQQQVVMLRFVGGQKPAEIAQSLNKSETAIRQLQLRALRTLGRLLEGVM